MVYSYHGSLDSLLQDDPFLHPKPWMQLFLVLSCCDFHPASAKDETKENSERSKDFVFACCAWLQSRKLNESSFFFVVHLHLGVKSFYTYVTIQSSLLQMATGLCLVCNSKRNNRTIEYQLKLLLKLFKRISIDILLFTVSQVNSKFPPHSLLAPLPLQF